MRWNTCSTIIVNSVIFNQYFLSCCNQSNTESWSLTMNIVICKLYSSRVMVTIWSNKCSYIQCITTWPVNDNLIVIHNTIVRISHYNNTWSCPFVFKIAVFNCYISRSTPNTHKSCRCTNTSHVSHHINIVNDDIRSIGYIESRVYKIKASHICSRSTSSNMETSTRICSFSNLVK